jgi:hypothetical protein
MFVDQKHQTLPAKLAFSQDAEGLTKREYLAAACLQGLLARPLPESGAGGSIKKIEQIAVETADRLIMALNGNLPK